jgi:hypothetical protein
MFHFPGFASAKWRMTPHDQGRVAPFGYPRIYGYLHLTVASRSLPRPSSLSCAKASTVCHLYLDLLLLIPTKHGKLSVSPIPIRKVAYYVLDQYFYKNRGKPEGTESAP